MIEISELYKYYGDRRAVGPLSVRIEKGQVVGLLGLNGAGKTTTLRILACDLLPTSGTVRIDGLDVVDVPDQVKARVGYLPDTPPVYPEMSISEYLTFAARLRGVPKADLQKRVDEAIDQTELGDERDSLIESLSHGFRQRVGIAQAIVHRPAFVVLDEPISGLDPAQIVEMRSLVRSLSGEHTVVVSSHNLPEISETCDRLLVIKSGRIVADGTEQDLTASRQGMRIEVTVRGTGPTSEVAASSQAVLSGLAAVRDVRIQKPSEPGEGIATLGISADADVRDLVCRTLIDKGFRLLELSRAERELEQAFLQLLASGRESASSSRAPSDPDLAPDSADAAADASEADDDVVESRPPENKETAS
ncbi:MAG TPA: ABC transporter ATP-binding protein [Polyangiaceae bacterium]